jgi:YidC/Oxa1 family membrane protein insertase
MDNPRLLLWLGLLFVLWLNVDAWMKDYARPATALQATTATTAPTAPKATLGESLPAVTTAQPATPAPAAIAPEAGIAQTATAPTAPRVHVMTDVLDIDISTVGGELTRADLTKYPLKKNDPSTPVRLFDSSPDHLYLYQSGLTTGQARPEPNHKAQFTAPTMDYRLAQGQDELRVPLTWTDGQGLTVTKTYVFRRGSYAVEVIYNAQNAGAAPVQLAPYAQFLRHWEHHERSMFDVESYAFKGPAIYDGEKYAKRNVEDEDESAYSADITNGWAASMQHHFVAAIVPAAGQKYHYGLKVDGKDYLLRVVGPAQSVPAGGALRITERLFVGPKLQAQLAKTGPRLELTADYGKLTILAQPLFWLLGKVHAFIGNWGLAIIIVTFLIKLVFYKLAETSGRSMAKMRTIAPRIKAMQERLKDDREAQAKAMMELYKREKINPVAGCLPVLVQIPFFLAFYWVLLESVEMRQAPFFGWIQDLSSRDPYFILPLIMGAAMYGQYKLNPTPPDPVQAKVFAFMPVVMTAMFAFFPSGLVLYWVTNTLLSIAQQYRINKLVEAEEKKLRT